MSSTAIKLFLPITLRNITLPNRIAVSPLCMYSAIDGVAQPWHFAHLSTFARGRAGLVFTEATAVEARGRITPRCLGIWTDEQAEALRPIVDFITSMGSVPGIQLAHSGRKGSTYPPFSVNGGQPLDPTKTEGEEMPWTTIAPSPIPVAAHWPCPRAMSADEFDSVKVAFASAAKRAVEIGFRVIELHMAHGYLLHSFLSPLSNQRTDCYGGHIGERMRFPLEIVEVVRSVIPHDCPLFVRISAIDGMADGWTMDESIVFCQALSRRGVDVVDCSSGGIAGAPRFRSDDQGRPLTKKSARAPGFQVPYARRARTETNLKSMAVGVIVDPYQAEEILQTGGADLIALGRELMHNPFWPLHAAAQLGVDSDFRMWPEQYAWAVDRRSQITRLNAPE